MMRFSATEPALPFGTTWMVSVEPRGTMRGSIAAQPVTPPHGDLLIQRVASVKPSLRITAAACASTCDLVTMFIPGVPLGIAAAGGCQPLIMALSPGSAA
jgi:hypothetical protein